MSWWDAEGATARGAAADERRTRSSGAVGAPSDSCAGLGSARPDRPGVRERGEQYRGRQQPGGDAPDGWQVARPLPGAGAGGPPGRDPPRQLAPGRRRRGRASAEFDARDAAGCPPLEHPPHGRRDRAEPEHDQPHLADVCTATSANRDCLWRNRWTQTPIDAVASIACLDHESGGRLEGNSRRPTVRRRVGGPTGTRPPSEPGGP